MPEAREPKKESNRQRDFITEKVVKQPLTKKQAAGRVVAFFCAAVAFGVAAAFSFAVSNPLAQRLVGVEETEESAISIPKDEPTEPAETDTPPPETLAESEPVEDQVKDAMEDYRFTVENLNAMLNSLRTRIQTANNGIVTVHSVHQNTDWFDNPVETTGKYAGAVIAQTAQELLILTLEEAVEEADAIGVIFSDGKEAVGRIKQRDTVVGMTIVSVLTEELEDSTLQRVSPLVLGNSYMVGEGDLIAAVGGPAGMIPSMDYGFVTYVAKNVQMMDRVGRVLYSSIRADADSGTFLINTEGQLIGWVMKPDEEEADAANTTKILGISEYKSILEKLTNGLGAPCFGIQGQEVSQAMVSQGLCQGIYVLNSVVDRPAYNAGIQNGDVITNIDGTEIITMKDFITIMDGMECGQLLHVTVQRNGREGYTELKFEVTVGAR